MRGDENGRLSPDGKLIAFVSRRGVDTDQVYLVNADGSALRQTSEFSRANLHVDHLCWSADSTRLALDLFENAPPTGHNAKIIVINVPR